jgi:hypothetical protein
MYFADKRVIGNPNTQTPHRQSNIKMDYITYAPNTDLSAFIKCYWTLEAPINNKHEKQRIETQISPEMGYFAMFIDTEGNKLALHSIK